MKFYMTEKQRFKSYSSRGLWPTKIQLAVALIRSTFRAITAITFCLECRFEVLLDGQEQLYRNKRCFNKTTRDKAFAYILKVIYTISKFKG